MSKKRSKQPKKKFNAKTIKIETQVYAKELYEKVGFVQKSEPFLEDGIPHILMEYTE
ncbi:MAG: GNAT family N-acetyltransferase [Anaerostipes sp.]